MHPFEAYLRRSGRTQQWAADKAREIGESLSQGYLSQLLRGKACPRPRKLATLSRVSGGRVSVSAMAKWHAEVAA